MILIDAGPMVALVDADDAHHQECVEQFKNIREPLGTVWPVITESMHLLRDQPLAQDALWSILERRAIGILLLDLNDTPRIRQLMHKYADLPMDLADASIIHVAEREGVRTIFTVDRQDFGVYRLHGRVRPHLIP